MLTQVGKFYIGLTYRVLTDLPESRNTSYQQYIANLSAGYYMIWKAPKKFKRLLVAVPLYENLTIVGHEPRLTKATVFTEHFTNLFTPLPRDANVNDK